MLITLVVARAKNGVIGAEGRLPWRLPADLRHFRRLTWGKPVVMGRRTFESIGRPLPGRHNIVLTRDVDWSAPGVTVAHGWPGAKAAAGEAEELMVIGGAEIYRLAWAEAQRAHVTHVDAAPAGDVRIPAFGPAEWVEVWCEPHPAEDGQPAFALTTLERRAAAPG